MTDEGLKELAALKNLTSLDIGNTQVTGEGIKELQKALPNCKITGTPRTRRGAARPLH
jgi:hypothetical protein